MRFKVFALASLGLVSAVASAAGPFAYVTNYRSELWKISLSSPAGAMISNIGFVAKGMASTTSGTLYACTSNKLYNITGGIPTPVVNLGTGIDIGALDSNGSTLWGYDNISKRIFEYDPIGLNFVQWSSTLSIPTNIQAMTIDPSGDFLVIDTSDNFGKITNGTWTTSLINAGIGLADTCEAMDFLSDGNLYAAIFGDIRYQLNPVTGTINSGFFSGVHRDWSAMTAAPNGVVPEPASLSVIGLGVLGFLRKRKK